MKMYLIAKAWQRPTSYAIFFSRCWAYLPYLPTVHSQLSRFFLIITSSVIRTSFSLSIVHIIHLSLNSLSSQASHSRLQAKLQKYLLLQGVQATSALNVASESYGLALSKLWPLLAQNDSLSLAACFTQFPIGQAMPPYDSENQIMFVMLYFAV